MEVRADWWHREGNRVVCDLCPRFCRLPEGAAGFCYVRKNSGGELVLSTYGRSTGFRMDPIEKKPLYHFYPGSSVLSFGTAGCNLGCSFCQNWTTTKSRQVIEESVAASPDTIARAAVRLEAKSVAFTYNDPVILTEYLIDTANACRARGVETVAVTNGYINPEPRKAFFDVLSAANIDLKGFTEAFYSKMTLSHLAPVLDTLRYVANETSVWLEITTLLIPGKNDDDDALRRMCDWVLVNLGPHVPMHFSAFHPAFKLLDIPHTPRRTLERARALALKAGIDHVYTGNVFDPEDAATYCASCRRRAIERDGYTLRRYDLDRGQCVYCEHPIAGRFDDDHVELDRVRPVLVDVTAVLQDIERESERPARTA